LTSTEPGRIVTKMSGQPRAFDGRCGGTMTGPVVCGLRWKAEARFV
jgi:hypothetical protein